MSVRVLQGRSLRRFGGRLALLGLWLQLVLSFGHMHPQDVWGPLGFRVETGHGYTFVTHDDGRRQGTADRQDAAALADGCTICATMALAAISVPPAPLRLPPPAGTVLPVRPTVFRVGHTVRSFLLFQTRGPPGAVIA